MEKRQDRLEWEVGVLKERYNHMNDCIGEMSIHMDQQHRELLAAIGSLKDDRARAEGVEATAAAKAAAREMMRGLIETGCSIVGRPAPMAGQLVIYAGVRQLVDGREFILDRVTHTFTKSGGLRTAFTGKLKAE